MIDAENPLGQRSEGRDEATDLCAWLREHSSGAYRRSADAADEIERLRAEIVAERETRDAWKDAAEHFYGVVRVALYGDAEKDYQATGELDAWAANKYPAIARAKEFFIERKAALDAQNWRHLKEYGYAPGHYMSRCGRCRKTHSDMDKRAITCRKCAEDAYADHIRDRGKDAALDALAETNDDLGLEY